MKVWDGAQWIEASAAQQASLVTYEYVATAGQTTFSGADANGVTLSYTVGNVFVAVNGVRIRPGDDFTATNGTSIVLLVAATAGDEIIIDAFRTFDVANTYTQAQANALLAGKLDASAGAVGTTNLANAAVNAAKIADATVTQPKLGANVAGNGPLVFAVKGSGGNQSISANTWTKITFPDEVFDTNNNFSGSTFTPTIAGHYWVRVAAAFNVVAGTQLGIYKNGILQFAQNSGSGSGDWLEVSGLVYCNGTTDTIEGWIWNPSAFSVFQNSVLTNLQAALIRSAT